MKRLSALFVVLSVVFCPLASTVSFTDEEYQELEQILDSLDSLNKEQQMTLEAQKQTIEQQQNKIKNLETTMTELQTLSKEQKKSSILTTILSLLTAFFTGFMTGIFVFRSY